MKALFYLLKCTYKNTLKRLFQKPAAAVITIFIMVCMLFPVITAYVSGKSQQPSPYLDSIVGGTTLAYGYLILFVILSSNTGIFYMSDVNLLFTAPVKPRQTLLYGVFGSFFGSLLMTIYMIVNLPLIGGSGVPFVVYFITGIFFIIFMVNITLIYYYSYILSIKFPKLIQNIKGIFLIILGLMFVFFIRCYIFSSHDFKTGAQMFFTSSYYHMLPVFGWVKWGVVSAIRGNYVKGMLPAALLQFGLMTGLTLLICNTDIDFYERAATDAQVAQTYKDKAKAGRQDVNAFYAKKVKWTKADFGEGAKALWSRQLLEVKKSGINMSYFKYLINPLYAFIMALTGMDTTQLVSFLIFINISFGSSESYMMDFKKPFIYLIPQSSLKKGFYNTLMAYCKSLLTGAAAFLVIFVMTDPKVSEIITFYVLYASYSLVFLYANLFSQRFLGAQSNMATAGFIRFIVILIGSVPSTIILVIIALITGETLNIFLQMLPTIIVNYIMAFVLLFLSRNIYETAELLD